MRWSRPSRFVFSFSCRSGFGGYRFGAPSSRQTPRSRSTGGFPSWVDHGVERKGTAKKTAGTTRRVHRISVDHTANVATVEVPASAGLARPEKHGRKASRPDSSSCHVIPLSGTGTRLRREAHGSYGTQPTMKSLFPNCGVNSVQRSGRAPRPLICFLTEG